METEIFKQIQDYPNYEISNLGTVKSLGNNRNRKEKILKQYLNHKGYYMVYLTKNAKTKCFYTHRLVAQAFILNPENKGQINHINGIKIDNKIENLEWCTNQENITHAYNNNLIKINYGESNGSSKLTKEQVLEIKQSKIPQRKLALIYNVNFSTIMRIKTGKTWKDI